MKKIKGEWSMKKDIQVKVIGTKQERGINVKVLEPSHEKFMELISPSSDKLFTISFRNAEPQDPLPEVDLFLREKELVVGSTSLEFENLFANVDLGGTLELGGFTEVEVADEEKQEENPIRGIELVSEHQTGGSTGLYIINIELPPDEYPANVSLVGSNPDLAQAYRNMGLG